jgi:hypothetical protein
MLCVLRHQLFSCGSCNVVLCRLIFTGRENQFAAIRLSPLGELLPSRAQGPDGFEIKQPNLKHRRAFRFLRHRTTASYDGVRQQYIAEWYFVRLAALIAWQPNRNVIEDIHL